MRFQMPKVSIIIPIYNVELYLRKCLDSILKQSLRDWEAICVDDGSTDDSGIIAREYSKDDERIRYILQENAGVAAARNAGLRYAKGSFIACIDPDDWVDSCHLEKLYEFAVERDLDYVSCNIAEESESGNVIRDQSIDCYDAKTMLIAILKRKIRGSACTGLYRKKAIDAAKVDFGDRIRCPIMEDTYFNAGFLLSNPRIGHVKYATYHYMIHEGTLSCFGRKNSSWWQKAISANESILSLLKGRVDDHILRYRAAMLKSWMMWADEVPHRMFLDYHPEICWLPNEMTNLRGNISFFVACLGFRNLVVGTHRTLKSLLHHS